MEATKEMVRLADLNSHPRNYNYHSDAQIARIAKSLQTFGQVRSIVTWRMTILAGHGVVEAARTLGWTEIHADVVDELSEDAALAYVVADNELARQSDPDQAQLAAILEELQAREPLLVEAAGYGAAELELLLAETEMMAFQDAAGGEGNQRGLSTSGKVKPVLIVHQVATFERAIRATGLRNRGEAVIAICQHYLETNEKGQLDAFIESLAEA